MIANENSNISSSRRDKFDIKLFANSRLPVDVAKSPPQKKKSKKKKKKRKRVVVEAVEESPHAKDKKKKVVKKTAGDAKPSTKKIKKSKK